MPGGVQWSCNKKRGMCHCNKIETTVPKNHSSMLSSLGSASYCMRRSSWGKDMPASCHSGRSQKLRNRANSLRADIILDTNKKFRRQYVCGFRLLAETGPGKKAETGTGSPPPNYY
ncbi:uncharacterized protein LOC26515293 [Drosophila ananassae]|uniref:uncharacterized protein LOC26515293 n=1 Tax=Drosophila ananassae TaxID=7217 RepID=UPI0013A5E447|nr:uncharacterized protein LOC26515293 [Drosophila ananassae]